jgi:UTP-glucose-1-phosphate uridylyltransferase
MNCRYRIKKYGLISQRKISQFEAKKLLEERGIVVNSTNVNCLFSYNLKESLKHFIVKAMIFKILRNKKRKVACEVEINNGIVDLLDIDNLIAYEVESKLTKRKIKNKLKNYRAVRDVIFIDLKKVPNNFEKAEKFLRKVIV